MNKGQIIGLSLALIAVIVLAQIWRSLPKAVYTPTPAAMNAPAAAHEPEFAASETSAPEPAPAADADATAEPPAPAAETPAEAPEPAPAQ